MPATTVIPGMRALQRRFYGCRQHPEEPLLYICLRCQSDCVCAECALHGEHRGHKLLRIREAAGALPSRVAELTASALAAARRQAAVAAHARAGRRDVVQATSLGQQALRDAVHELHATLEEEEAAMLEELEQFSANVAEALNVEDEVHLKESCDMLSQWDAVGDAAQTLKWYIRLKQDMETTSIRPPDAGSEIVQQLRSQLRQGLDSRLSSVGEVEARMAALQPWPWPDSQASAASRLSSSTSANARPGARTSAFVAPPRNLGQMDQEQGQRRQQ